MGRRPALSRCGPAAPAALATALLAGLAALLAVAGCHSAKLLAPEPTLAAASASLFAIDVEFDRPVERTTAEDRTRYAVHPAGRPDTSYAIASATLVDTLEARVVQLLLPDWLGDSTFDHADFEVVTDGVVDYLGRSTGVRRVTFRSGLAYRADPGAPEASGLASFFDAHCTRCHGAAADSGLYRCNSYAALFGAGIDATPDLIAGDPACLLVRKCKPHNSMFDRGGMDYFDYERLRNWVGEYRARD